MYRSLNTEIDLHSHLSQKLGQNMDVVNLCLKDLLECYTLIANNRLRKHAETIV